MKNVKKRIEKYKKEEKIGINQNHLKVFYDATNTTKTGNSKHFCEAICNKHKILSKHVIIENKWNTNRRRKTLCKIQNFILQIRT